MPRCTASRPTATAATNGLRTRDRIRGGVVGVWGGVVGGVGAGADDAGHDGGPTHQGEGVGAELVQGAGVAAGL
ncbi:hypothetical protein, partial [Pseudactinotalea terrae]|uniref:hypothetical protein n=1 Tax=Pseudactinotalea terrae TaxID=1743262 RepID=UPI0019D5146C